MRYALSAGPPDVGQRVVVRHALPGGGASDVIGELVRWDGGCVRVRRCDGEVVEVAESAVLAAKRVPPPPPRRPRLGRA